MVTIDALRTLRGWRWRIFAVVLLISSYWLGRMPGFGGGAVVWFSGGIRGIQWITLMMAAGAGLLAVESIAQWQRRGAAALLQPRLIHPLTFFAAKGIAIILACLVPATVAALWASVGAWRSGHVVLWQPAFLYLAAGALPVLFCAVGAGLFARTLLPTDTGALTLTGIILAPVLVFRLWLAPISEVFRFASDSLGILLPWETVVREAGVCILVGLGLIAAASFLLPSPRGATPRRHHGFFRHFDMPLSSRILRKLLVQLRQWKRAGALIALAFLLLGGWSAGHILSFLPEAPTPDAWSHAHPPGEAFPGPILPVRITSRDIDLTAGVATGPAVIIGFEMQSTTATLAAFTFGPAFEVTDFEAQGGLQASIIPDGLPTTIPGVLVQVESEAVVPGERFLRFQLKPRLMYRRQWERAWHPKYHRFASLPDWYGETMAVDFVNQSAAKAPQSAPFTIRAPEEENLLWLAGSAKPRESGGAIELVQPRADWPSRLIAADLIIVSPPDNFPLDVRFSVQEHRRELMKSFYVIYATQFQRLARLFGDPAQPIVLYEVPEQDPGDSLALSSSLLDALEVLLPRFRHFLYPTRKEFYRLFPRIHGGLVREMVAKNFDGIEHPELLYAAFADYLNRYALGEGRYPELVRITGQDLILVPWKLESPRLGKIDIPEKEAGAWRGPIFENLRDWKAPAPDPRRRIAFFHMLRGMLGDDTFAAAVRSLFENHQGEPLTIELLRSEMETAYGEDLGWFFNQWLYEGITPKPEIIEAQALLVENPEDRRLEYHTRVILRNSGTGSVPFSWLLDTEGAPLEGKVVLEAGKDQELTLISSERPLAFEVDPENWVPQIIGKGEDGTVRVFFKSIQEL